MKTILLSLLFGCLPAFASCSLAGVSDCVTVPTCTDGAQTNSGYPPSGVTSVTASCINYFNTNHSCGITGTNPWTAPANSSCQGYSVYTPSGATASTGMILQVHSGGFDAGNRWIGINNNPGTDVILANGTNRTVVTIDYELTHCPGCAGATAIFPQQIVDLDYMIDTIVADAGSTITGNRQDIVLVGDSMSVVSVADWMFQGGAQTNYTHSCPAAHASTSAYHITKAALLYGIWCGMAGCTNISYTPPCDSGNAGCATVFGFGTTTYKNLFGTTNQATTVSAATAAMFDPAMFITQANIANLQTPMYIGYGTTDPLASPDLSVAGLGCSCGSGPMHGIAAQQMLAALSPPIYMRAIPYDLCANGATTCGGHEQAFYTGVSGPMAFLVDWINGMNWNATPSGATLH